MLVRRCGEKCKRNCENYITILLGVMTRISDVTNCTSPLRYVGKEPTYLRMCILFVPMLARESFTIKLCVGAEIYAFTLKIQINIHLDQFRKK